MTRSGTPAAASRATGRLARLGGQARARLAQALFSASLYNLTLGGGAPTTVATVPHEPWLGDPERGEAMLAGDFALAGEVVSVPAAGPEFATAPAGALARQLFSHRPGRAWRRELHSFSWLWDLCAVGGERPRRLARAVLAAWLAHYNRWDALAWAPGVLGSRLGTWLAHHDFLLASADDELRSRALASVRRQARHLARLAPGTPVTAEAFEAAKGLLYAGAAFPVERRFAQAGQARLARALAHQVLPDGGHISRAPACQLTVLRRLIDCRAILRQAGWPVPDALQTGIDRMTPMLRFLRLGDGALATTGSSPGLSVSAVELTLTHADMGGKPAQSAPHSGFERLTGGRTIALMDTGALPPPGGDHGAAAGLLAVQLSAGRERLIVNCGHQPGLAGVWQESQRATAAHSTIVVADRNAAEVCPEAGLGRRPDSITAERHDSEAGTLIDASHDGYWRSCGIIVRRLLYLDAEGTDLRGEDRLEGAAGQPFAIRFHIHPDCRCALSQDGTTALLRPPGGAGWRLRATGAHIALAASVYLGEPDRIRRTTQIVLSGTSAGGTTAVKWALQQESGQGSRR